MHVLIVDGWMGRARRAVLLALIWYQPLSEGVCRRRELEQHWTQAERVMQGPDRPPLIDADAASSHDMMTIFDYIGGPRL